MSTYEYLLRTRESPGVLISDVAISLAQRGTAAYCEVTRQFQCAGGAAHESVLHPESHKQWTHSYLALGVAGVRVVVYSQVAVVVSVSHIRIGERTRISAGRISEVAFNS
jgi:hypothetical protein